MNSGLERLEAAWHLRAALNVAALSCRDRASAALPGSYNQFLKVQKAGLAQAFAAEQARYRDNDRAVDTHLTHVYNYFAWPPAGRGFCAVANVVAPQMAAMAPSQFLDAAPAALARIDAVFVGPEVAAGQPAVASAPVHMVAASDAPGWRVQFGAYAGQQRAEAAWQAVSRQLPSIAGHRPYFQPVPGQANLVRLQTQPPLSKPDAVQLCARAVAARIDCLIVAD